MRILPIILFCCMALHTCSQDKTEFDGHHWKAPYDLSVPKDWTFERFLIPISFAPTIPYKGVEDIRFTPGWGKKESDEYWSYAFLWYLDGDVNLNAKTIEKNIKAYYTGLATINVVPKDKIIPVQASFIKSAEDAEVYSGTIKMTDYMTQKPITLNCKIYLRKCNGENKTFIFHELSPHDFKHKVFAQLHELWMGFKCIQ